MRSEVERVLHERAGARIEGALRVDWLGRIAFGPLTIPAGQPNRPAVVRVEGVTVRPRWLGLLQGRIAVAAVELRGARVEAGAGGEELVRLAERLRGAPRHGAAAAAGSSLPELSVRGLVVAWNAADGDPFAVGPVDVRLALEPAAKGSRIAAEVRFPGGGRARVEVGPRGGRTSLRVAIQDLRTEALPSSVAARLPFHVKNLLLAASLEADGLESLTAGAAGLEVDVRELVLTGERIAVVPLGPVHLFLSGRLRWDLEARRLALEDADVALGEHGQAHVSLAASVGGRREEPRFAVSTRADGLGYAVAVAALPEALAPPADAPRPDGPLSARFELSGPLRRPAEWELTAGLDLSRLKRAARWAAPPTLAGTFRYRPAPGDREIVVGPENPAFLRLDELPSHVVRAITTSEDAGFFAHPGFDFAEMRNAFVEGAEAGRVVRGGSTITQQLAKNLFLSGERTVARKVREALVTVALEASLGKPRLLELYLNVVEWGPGIYGIGEASRHYFGKDARALTPREAAFLATLIPNPVRYHVYYDRGALTDAWNERVNELLLKMREAGQLTDEQFARALGEPLVFARG